MVVGLFLRAFARRCARAMMSVISDIPDVCNLLHTRSSSFLHSRSPSQCCQNGRMDVKQRIKSIIDSREDLTIRNVALKAGMSDSSLNKFLNNAEQSTTLRSLEKIADALGVSLRWLMFGEDDQPQVIRIWDHIPQRKRADAIRVLSAFVDEEKAGGAKE